MLKVGASLPQWESAGQAGTKGGRTLIVSRGLGMERGQAPRIRFLCRPELVVVDLVPREVPASKSGD